MSHRVHTDHVVLWEFQMHADISAARSFLQGVWLHRQFDGTTTCHYVRFLVTVKYSSCILEQNESYNFCHDHTSSTRCGYMRSRVNRRQCTAIRKTLNWRAYDALYAASTDNRRPSQNTIIDKCSTKDPLCFRYQDHSPKQQYYRQILTVCDTKCGRVRRLVLKLPGMTSSLILLSCTESGSIATRTTVQSRSSPMSHHLDVCLRLYLYE